jgi:ATP-dependent DNA helicase DinG
MKSCPKEHGKFLAVYTKNSVLYAVNEETQDLYNQGIVAPVLSPLEFFPMDKIREKQEKALDFFERGVKEGFRHMIIEAPTGTGKSAIGVALCHWATQTMSMPGLSGQPGGYYLVTQKMLQDQLQGDLSRYMPEFREGVSLKSAVEYKCQVPKYENCGIGGSSKEGCPCKPTQDNPTGTCPYTIARRKFMAAPVAITNYPYFLTERAYVKQFQKRRILICDECHTLEKQLLAFVEVTVSENDLDTFAPLLKSVPRLPKIDDFIAWADEEYLPFVEQRWEYLQVLVESGAATGQQKREYLSVDNHYKKIAAGIESMNNDPKNWVYWQESDPKTEKLNSMAKPLDAAPYTKPLFEAADIVVYMSAYPGEKNTFCRSLGLNPDEVKRKRLDSTFPVKNRPVILCTVGSMSKRNVDNTLPAFLRQTERIMKAHTNEKGIIHVGSYKLGEAIWNHFQGSLHEERLLFARNADERKTCFEQHVNTMFPTVIISPSMTEGFDFKDDLARWQIIAKVPYPYLGDKQVAAKKDIDPDWYTLQAVMSIIQAVGRVCRSETDTGKTYILDQDFHQLYERAAYMFPKWFTEAFVYPR